MTPIVIGSLCYLALDGIGYLFGPPVAMGVGIGIVFTSGLYLLSGREASR
jgi:hypothetical protein